MQSADTVLKVLRDRGRQLPLERLYRHRYSPAAAPPWVQTMRDSRRKTLIVCARCHGDIHQQPHTQ